MKRSLVRVQAHPQFSSVIGRLAQLVEHRFYTARVAGSSPAASTMAEIKQFKPSIKERPKPEKPADVVNLEQVRKKETFVFPDTESGELMETLSGMARKIFEESGDKRKIIEQLRKLADNLEEKLRK